MLAVTVRIVLSIESTQRAAARTSRGTRILQLATRMATYGTLQPFQPDDEGIAAYLERAAIYFTANGIEETKQVPVFLSVVGGKVYALLRDLLVPAKPSSKTFTELSDTLKGHFEPKPLVIAERYYFYNRHQKPSESIADFVAELRRFATHCEFGDHLNEALRDRLVCGMRHKGIQQRLLSEFGLTLTKAIEIAQGMEAAERNARKLQNGDTQYTDEVHKVEGSHSQREEQQRGKACYRCGATDHLASTCRFKNATCHNCRKKGHIAKVCRSRSQSQSQFGENTGQQTTHNVQETSPPVHQKRMALQYPRRTQAVSRPSGRTDYTGRCIAVGESGDHSAQASQPDPRGASQRSPWHHQDEGTSTKLLVVAWTGQESGEMCAGVPSLPSHAQRTSSSPTASLALADQAMGKNTH